MIKSDHYKKRKRKKLSTGAIINEMGVHNSKKGYRIYEVKTLENRCSTYAQNDKPYSSVGCITF